MRDGENVENDQREDPQAQRILRLEDEGEEKGGGPSKRDTE